MKIINLKTETGFFKLMTNRKIPIFKNCKDIKFNIKNKKHINYE